MKKRFALSTRAQGILAILLLVVGLVMMSWLLTHTPWEGSKKTFTIHIPVVVKQEPSAAPPLCSGCDAPLQGGVIAPVRTPPQAGQLILERAVHQASTVQGLDWIFNPFWWVGAAFLLLGAAVTQRFGAKGFILTLLVGITGLGLYWLWQLGEAIMDWKQAPPIIFLGTSLVGFRVGFALIVVLIQLYSLISGMIHASDERHHPLGLLKGYVAWIIISGCAIALAPISWGFPWLLWTLSVVATTYLKGMSTVVMTTGFYKAGANGNRRLNAHDKGAISGTMNILTWGHLIGFGLTSLWSAANLIGLF